MRSLQVCFGFSCLVLELWPGRQRSQRATAAAPPLQPEEMAAPQFVPAIAATLRRFHAIPAAVRCSGGMCLSCGCLGPQQP